MKAPIRNIADLPGPKGFPFIGNLNQIDHHRMHLSFEDWAEEYGDTYLLHFGRTPMVVMSNIDVLHEALRDRPARFRRQARMLDILSELGGVGLFVAEGDDWQRQRRLIMPLFQTRRIAAYYDRIVVVVQRLLDKWGEAADSGEVVDVLADMYRFAVDVTSVTAFGHDSDVLTGTTDSVQQHIQVVFPAIQRRLNSPFPYWRYLKLPQDRRLDDATAALRAHVTQVIAEARARMEADPELMSSPTNMLEAMLVAHDANDPSERFSDDDIFNNVLTMLLAGEDTTAASATWMMYYLATEGITDRVRDEVDVTLGNAPFLNDISQGKSLKLLDAFINEALRLRGAAPFIFLQAGQDTTLGDLSIPRGTPLIMLLRRAATRPEAFDEAMQFDPDRWLVGGRDARRHANHHSLPFGAGPRMCPGRSLAMLEMMVVASMVCRNFELEMVTDGSDMKEVVDFVMHPVELKMKFHRRS